MRTKTMLNRGMTKRGSGAFGGTDWTIATDSSGNGNNGTLVGFDADPRTTDVVSGASGKSIPLNGTTQYINVDSVVSDLAATTVGSLSVWVKATDATPVAVGRPIAICDTDTALRISIQQNTNGKIRSIAVNAANTTQWALDTDAAIDTLSWTHLLLVQDGVSPVLYVNGVAVAQTFLTTVDKTFWFNSEAGFDNGRIGCTNVNSAGNSGFWDGSIDEVNIYTAAMSADNATHLYNSFRGVGGGTNPGTGNRVGYWSLN